MKILALLLILGFVFSGCIIEDTDSISDNLRYQINDADRDAQQYCTEVHGYGAYYRMAYDYDRANVLGVQCTSESKIIKIKDIRSYLRESSVSGEGDN